MNKKEFYECVRIKWTFWRNYDIKEDSPVTFCNCFVADVCLLWNYKKINNGQGFVSTDGLWPMLANQMHRVFKTDKDNWLQVNTERAMEEMHDCNLVIASRTAKYHGHVCVLLPSSAYSGKWKKRVPLAANIGKTNRWNKSVSYSFKKEPEYFLKVKNGL